MIALSAREVLGATLGLVKLDALTPKARNRCELLSELPLFCGDGRGHSLHRYTGVMPASIYINEDRFCIFVV